MKSPDKTKILIVAESIDIDDSSGTKGRVALIQNLKEIGYDLKVFHYSRKDINLDNIDCVEIKEKRKSFYFVLSRIERYLRYFFKFQLNKPLEKTFGFSFTLLNDRDSIIAALRNDINFEPDLVFTLSKGGSFRPHHALLHFPKWYSKWVAYMHDPYPMHMYPKPFPWKEPGFKQKEEFIKKVSERAKHPVFPSLLLKNWMGSFFPAFIEKGKIIPHQLNERVLPATIIEIPGYFDIKKFNILHAGNLLQARQPQGLVEAYELFLKDFPEAKLISQLTFIGPAGHHKDYLNQKSKSVSSLLVIPDNRKFEEVSRVQDATVINVILEAKSEISPFLPGKFPHCVKANKPILHLGPENSETKRLLGSKYPYWAQIDDIIKIASIFGDLFQEWKKDPHLKFNRTDLEVYLSTSYLKMEVEKMHAE